MRCSSTADVASVFNHRLFVPSLLALMTTLHLRHIWCHIVCMVLHYTANAPPDFRVLECHQKMLQCRDGQHVYIYNTCTTQHNPCFFQVARGLCPDKLDRITVITVAHSSSVGPTCTYMYLYALVLC